MISIPSLSMNYAVIITMSSSSWIRSSFRLFSLSIIWNVGLLVMILFCSYGYLIIHSNSYLSLLAQIMVVILIISFMKINFKVILLLSSYLNMNVAFFVRGWMVGHIYLIFLLKMILKLHYHFISISIFSFYLDYEPIFYYFEFYDYLYYHSTFLLSLNL